MKIQRYKISLYRHNVDKKKVTPHKTETELHLRTYSALANGLFFSSDGKIVMGLLGVLDHWQFGVEGWKGTGGGCG